MHYYHVMIGDKHIDLIKAQNKDDALIIAIQKFGLATNYIKNGSYRVIKA
jgi:hypothetical protein